MIIIFVAFLIRKDLILECNKILSVIHSYVMLRLTEFSRNKTISTTKGIVKSWILLVDFVEMAMGRKRPILRSHWWLFRILTRRHLSATPSRWQAVLQPSWVLWTRLTIFTIASTRRWIYRIWQTYLPVKKLWSSNRRKWLAPQKQRWAMLSSSSTFFNYHFYINKIVRY